MGEVAWRSRSRERHAPSPNAHPTVWMRTRHNTRGTQERSAQADRHLRVESEPSSCGDRDTSVTGRRPLRGATQEVLYIAHSTRLMNLLTVSYTEYLLKQITWSGGGTIALGT